MATDTTTGAAGQAAACPLARLESALCDALCLAVPALDQAVGLARLALAYMEDPRAMRNTEPLAQAFESILSAADQAMDGIHAELEHHGIDLAQVSGQDRRKRRQEALFPPQAEPRADTARMPQPTGEVPA